MELSPCPTGKHEESLTNAPSHKNRVLMNKIMSPSSQNHVRTDNSNSTKCAHDRVIAPSAFTLQKRRLKAALGDLKKDSDAPPAVRLLVSQDDDDEKTKADSLNTTGTFVLAETSMNVPGCHSRTRGPFDTMSEERRKLCLPPTERVARRAGMHFPDVDTQENRSEALVAIQESEDVTENPALFTVISRDFSSCSSSKVSASRSGQRQCNGEEMMAFTLTTPRATTKAGELCAGKRPTRRRYTVCSERSKRTPRHAKTMYGRTGTYSRTVNNMSAPEADRSPSSFLSEPQTLLQPLQCALAAASYPPPMRSVPGHCSCRHVLEWVFSVNRTERKARPLKVEGDTITTNSKSLRNKINVGSPPNVFTKQHEGESAFSHSTPRRQSTNSSSHHALASTLFRYRPHPQRASMTLWSTQSDHITSGTFSYSLASPEKDPCSPFANSTVYQSRHPSGNVEWIQQHLLNQPSHTCHLPVFGNRSGSPGSVGNGGTQFAPLASSRMQGNNSVSSLIFTRTLSNVEAIPTCSDAPIDAFMDSSICTSASLAPHSLGVTNLRSQELSSYMTF